MANSLLDFVMALVRDPDAAARYAADPAGAIADAHLTGVSSIDVNNLIPMVADSLSMAAPAFGGDHAADGNVWASGAATAAFDAFDAHVPAVVADQHPVIADGVAHPAEVAQSVLGGPGVDALPAGLDPAAAISEVIEPVAEHPADSEGLADWVDHGGWGPTHVDSHVDDAHPAQDHPGFDLF